MDVLPTFARLAAAELPKNKIDGHDIWPMITHPETAKTPYEVFYSYYRGEMQAIRSGKWKLVFPHKYRTLAGREGGRGGQPVPYEITESQLALYNLDVDVDETDNVYDKYPEVVARLQRLADIGRKDLGDRLTGIEGSGVRPPGRL
jgi:arylsulfatase A-like enzyme